MDKKIKERTDKEIWKNLWREFVLFLGEWWHKAPYRGVCPVCQKRVYHWFPWRTKNPLKYQDVLPLHNKCAFEYFFDLGLDISVKNWPETKD